MCDRVLWFKSRMSQQHIYIVFMYKRIVGLAEIVFENGGEAEIFDNTDTIDGYQFYNRWIQSMDTIDGYNRWLQSMANACQFLFYGLASTAPCDASAKQQQPCSRQLTCRIPESKIPRTQTLSTAIESQYRMNLTIAPPPPPPPGGQ